MPAKNADSTDLLTQDQAAQVLNLTNPRTLASWRLRKTGPPFCRLNRAVRYPRADLLAWVQARRVAV